MAHKVLFVDDSQIILKTVLRAFRKEPYQVLVAESGEEGMLIAEAERPDVIVSDLRMPGMDGLAFLREVKKIHNDWVGMIFTAYTDLNAIMEAVHEEYVWRYITKPWADNRELVIAVDNAVQYLEEKRARQHAEQILARSKYLAGLGRLAAAIAHQFNNINVGIIGYSEMSLRHAELPGSLRQNLEAISTCAKRATEIIYDLTKLSNYSSGKFKPCDLALVAKDALSMLQKEIAAEGVRVEARLAHTPKLDMDYGLMRLLVVNLLTNAWQATVGGYEPVVWLETGVDDRGMFLKVADHGCGIPADHLNKIFEPFYSTKGYYAEPGSPKSLLRGVGLGLSMSHTIADSHGGQLLVESEVDKGATFTLLFPVKH